MRGAALILILGLVATPAFGSDDDAIANALVAAFNGASPTQFDAVFKASYGNASARGDDVTITDFKIIFAGATVTIGGVPATGVNVSDYNHITATAPALPAGSNRTENERAEDRVLAQMAGLTDKVMDHLKL